jgi:hypothetical protein
MNVFMIAPAHTHIHSHSYGDWEEHAILLCNYFTHGDGLNGKWRTFVLLGVCVSECICVRKIFMYMCLSVCVCVCVFVCV